MKKYPLAPALTSLEKGTPLAETIWGDSLTYIKTIVDTAHEPFLILDQDLRVMVANQSFYTTFEVLPADTENVLVYELGGGEWDIPSLRKLLENLLPKNTFFRGYEVVHDFPKVGRKTMILNACRIYRDTAPENVPPIILLAMEDVSEMMSIAEKFANQSNHFEKGVLHRIRTLEDHISSLKMPGEDI